MYKQDPCKISEMGKTIPALLQTSNDPIITARSGQHRHAGSITWYVAQNMVGLYRWVEDEDNIHEPEAQAGGGSELARTAKAEISDSPDPSPEMSQDTDTARKIFPQPERSQNPARRTRGVAIVIVQRQLTPAEVQHWQSLTNKWCHCFKSVGPTTVPRHRESSVCNSLACCRNQRGRWKRES